MRNKNNTGEIIGCPCGNASMNYEIIDIDLYIADAYNTIIVNEGYGKACICRNCKQVYDHFDPCMVKYIKHIRPITEYSVESILISPRKRELLT